ncbi:MAG: DUF2200 family protein [Bacteroidales bacterium]|nr:DUF2200 family protein [Bacteroidales bacterium]MDT8430708.1 DUF2200 family protein [Bacteroidales bacterium]
MTLLLIAGPGRSPWPSSGQNTLRNKMKDYGIGVVAYKLGKGAPTNPLTQQVRYLDKLVDELAKGKKMEKILSTT